MGMNINKGCRYERMGMKWYELGLPASYEHMGSTTSGDELGLPASSGGVKIAGSSCLLLFYQHY